MSECSSIAAMKCLPLLIAGVLFALPAWSLPPLAPDEIAQLHWLSQTATEARLRTQAAAAWLEDPGAEPERWREQVDIRFLSLARQAERQQPANTALVDGMLGWLVHARARPLDASMGTDPLLVQTLLQGLDTTMPEAVLRAGAVWARVEERLASLEDGDPALEISAFWAGQQALANRAAPQQRDQARALASLAAELSGLAGRERLEGLGALARSLSSASWSQGEELQALWHLMDALVIQAAVEPGSEIDAIASLLAAMTAADPMRLRRIDEQLPVVLAQIQDAAAYLGEQPPALDAAISELTDAYFRLALFVSDAAFYLNQPVREHLVAAVEDCLPNPDLVGPLPRETFDQCPERLFVLLDEGLDSEELVGGSGPYAADFLRRETELLSWQRSRYLDGHLDWQLQASCEPVAWVNPLEWSILVQALASWVPQRPVFFGDQRWQNAMGKLSEQIEDQEASRVAWLDCLTGLGGQRLDPVSRLLIRHGQVLSELALALDASYREFVAEQTRPGSDIDLDAAADQVTGYRPEGLVVRPCAGGSTCGARTVLPVSRALLGLFPNTYLLADQLAIGSLALCYDQVRWEDREMRPARPGDDQVANYFGRLSFELVGTFDDGSGEQNVFRQRLAAAESRHYLFAAASEEILEKSCPDGLAGQPVASHLPEDRLGLVPNRLTYFAATPATPDAQLLANWEQGAEWRDWFITGDRVEVLEAPRPAVLQARLQAELKALVSRRERVIASRLLSDTEDDSLSVAMASVDASRALIRRVLEIHYPRLIRHDAAARSAFSGLNALVGREQVRTFRNAARPLSTLADEGRSRLLEFQQFWQDLPLRLREQGQSSPEADHARRLLNQLRTVSAAGPADVESSPGP
ncbi:hypothetical protein [Wenzhouxiangella limi]|uniref:DUF3160 domain-containing protein n=1 Tax=Wenzhouxiangella limi TaxID=2707351 RepID=A0A845V0Y4_9GAMM|nr:hypothetical protein [Wenzhouxiangella limi]NDY94926.1 hypothetical protein [Wenzhouxiangella limi]